MHGNAFIENRKIYEYEVRVTIKFMLMIKINVQQRYSTQSTTVLNDVMFFFFLSDK